MPKYYYAAKKSRKKTKKASSAAWMRSALYILGVPLTTAKKSLCNTEDYITCILNLNGCHTRPTLTSR